MPNPEFSDLQSDIKGRAASPPSTGVRGPTKDMSNVKPGPAGGLPGKSGPSRSAGVTKAKTFPKSEGI